jgi:peptide/nickel transport system substrate-binding protein
MTRLLRRTLQQYDARALLGVTTLALCVSCGDQKVTSTGGVLRIATAADADALIPPMVATLQGKQVVDQLFDHLAEPVPPLRTVGDAGFRPQLAARWTWAPDSLSVAFALNPKARWHDGTPVRARDVAFSFALFTDPAVASPHASNFAGIDSVSLRDSLTAVVWWGRRHPEQFFQVAYNLAILPSHLLENADRAALASTPFATAPVGSGRYRLERWTKGSDLVLRADSANYRGRPGYDRVVWLVAPDPTAAGTRLRAGEADVLDQVRGELAGQLRADPAVQLVDYGSLQYASLLLNHARATGGARGLFAPRALRVALTQALDRPALVANALDSLGQVALGPVPRSEPTADAAMRQLAYDTTAAARALDSLGWRRANPTGERRRNGQPLAFAILTPASSSTRQRLAVLLQEQYRRLGITVTVDAVDPATFGKRLAEGDFDTALHLWQADPSPATIRQAWGSPQGTEIGANFSRYRNAQVDALVDSAAGTFNEGRRTALFRQAYQLMVDDAAAVWLYEPRNLLAVRRTVAPTGARADGWWGKLADWRPAGGR